MSYRIHWDGIYTSIENSVVPPDYHNCFSTLAEAKKVVLDHLLSVRDGYNYCIRQIRSLKVLDLEENSDD